MAHPIDAELTNVGPSGAIAALVVPEQYTHERIASIIVTKSEGSATSFDAVVSMDPLVSDPSKTVTTLLGGNGASLHYDNSGRGYPWTPIDTFDEQLNASRVYIKVIPDQGTDSVFKVRILVED